MGWRATLRSIEAANRQAAREQDRARRAIHRKSESLLRETESASQQGRRHAQRIVEGIVRRPIQTLGLRYLPESGFEASPIAIETEQFSLSLSGVYISSDSDKLDKMIEPSELSSHASRVEVLDFVASEFCTLVAFRVTNTDPSYRIRLSWLKKSDLRESPVFLIDERNSEYYYPIESSLIGEVVADHPRVGIIAFEPFRHPTDEFTVHLSELKLSSERGRRYSGSLACRSDQLESAIQECLRRPPLLGRIHSEIDRVINRTRSEITQARASALKSQSGCCIAIVAAFGALGASLALRLI